MSTWIPGFCDGITLEDVATHRAGLAYAPLGARRMDTRQSRLDAMRRWQPDLQTRGHIQFALTSTGWVIWEIIETVTGLSLPDYLAQRIAAPLGLTVQDAVPIEEQHNVAPMVLLGDSADELDVWGPWYLDPPEVLARGEPSHSIVGTAADVVMHYQGMLHSDVWSRKAVAEGCRERYREPAYGRIEHGGTDHPISMGLFVTVRGESGSRAGCPPPDRLRRWPRRSTVSAVVLRPGDRDQLRVPDQRLPGVGLRAGPVGEEPVDGLTRPGRRSEIARMTTTPTS